MSAKSDGPGLPPDPDRAEPALEGDATYWTSAYPQCERVRPNDGPAAVGILADPAVPLSLIGIAYPTGHIGGVTLATPWAELADAPPPEVVWRLVLDRFWQEGRARMRDAKRTLDGRFALRRGRFVALGEDAV